MITAIRLLCVTGVLSGVGTLACIGGARSCLTNEEAAKSLYTAPADMPFAASVKGKTYHAIDCPLLPAQHEHDANLIYFRSEYEAVTAGKAPCAACVQRMRNADVTSIKRMPTTTPRPKDSDATSQY